MKIFLFSILYITAISVSAQVNFPGDGYIDNTGDYALINYFQNLQIDKENASVSFDFVEDDTSGTIEIFELKINFNPADPDNASFSGEALIKTLETGNFLRDGHLMWQKFFYKKKFPKISFKSTQVVSFGENTYKVIGNLAIKGTEKEAIITFTLDDKKLLGNTTIYTSDFGVKIHDKREKNKLNIQFDFPIVDFKD